MSGIDAVHAGDEKENDPLMTSALDFHFLALLLRNSIALALLAVCACVSSGCTHVAAPVRQYQGISTVASAIAWSRDGKLIAAAEAGVVHVWDAASGEQLAQTSGYLRHGFDYDPTGMDFAPDGRWLAFGGADGVVYLWDWSSDEKRELHGQPRTLRICRFSPDGQLLATASGGLVYPPSLASTTAPVHRIPEHARPQIEPMTIIAFDVQAGGVRSRVDASGMINIALSADAQQFAGTKLNLPAQTKWPLHFNDPEMRSASWAPVELRQTLTDELVRTFPATGFPIVFSPDGKLWTGGQIWDTHTFQLVREGRVGSTVFIDGGRRILDWSSSAARWALPLGDVPPLKYHLVYVDLATGRRRNVGDFRGDGFAAALDNVYGYSPDSRWVVDRQLKLWRVPR